MTLTSTDAARAIRRAAGMSQEQMADELGVHRMTLVRWETGERSPRGEMVARYAVLLEQLSRG